jgi:primosomal protein N' (replication factor Y)
VAAPLKLKRQSVAKAPQKLPNVSKNLPIASVLVDTPVSSLEGIYDYLVPEIFDESAVTGTKVLVEFGSGKAEGLVVGRKDKSDQTQKLKPILDLTSPSGMVSETVISHIEMVRNRFGGSFWTVLNSAVPSRVAKEEKLIKSAASTNESSSFDSPELRELIGRADFGQLLSKQRLKWGINFPIATDPNWFLLEIVKLRAQVSQILLIVPDEKDISTLSAVLANHFGDGFIELGSHLSKSLRYRNFLKTRYMTPKVIISTRSGVFAPLEKNATVIVLSDLDSSHYELHSPGWNTRDVTLLRDHFTSLIFISPSHSLEIARLIEIGWLEKKLYKQKNTQRFLTNENGNSYVSTIKKGISNGNVLVSVSEKGYANLFLCSKCRNTANCECGGKLQIDGSKKIPKCYLCQTEYKNWKCSFCADNRPFVIAKGIERTAEEIGRAIPKIAILVSSGNKQISSVPSGRHIVVSTAGSEPNGVYSSVVMLDGEKIFNRPSLRAEELAKFHWFSLLSKASNSAEIFLSLPNHHPSVQCLLRGDSLANVASELNSRDKAKLPPFYRVAVVVGDKPEISKFAENLRNDKTYEITGPITVDSYQSKLLIRVKLAEGSLLVDLLDDVIKVQALKRRKIFSIRFDPFDL